MVRVWIPWITGVVGNFHGDFLKFFGTTAEVKGKIESVDNIYIYHIYIFNIYVDRTDMSLYQVYIYIMLYV